MCLKTGNEETIDTYAIDRFYQTYDITLEVDLLGDIFIRDPLWIICSPGFSKAEDLEDYITKNLDYYTYVLEDR